MKSASIYHMAAIFTAIVWGSTFISSKILLNYGLTPATIMAIRFIIAYICLWRAVTLSVPSRMTRRAIRS